MEVLILAGGKGTRLASVLADVPKPMAPILQKPFLDYLVMNLKYWGLRKITFLTGYKHELIKSYFGIENFCYSYEEQPLGTGGAIKKSIRMSQEETFLVLNGDTFYDIDFSDFINKSEGASSIALRTVEDCQRYGSVEIDKKNNVTQFNEKKLQTFPEKGLINGGIYLLTREIISYIDEGFVSLENSIFPRLVNDKKLKGIPMFGHFIDIGIPEDYLKAQTLIPQWMDGKNEKGIRFY